MMLMESDFRLAIRAKAGDKDAMRSLWNTHFRDRQDSESALLLVRGIEGFDPGKVINRAGWKFSELLAGVTA
jgi:hypothetical protein